MSYDIHRILATLSASDLKSLCRDNELKGYSKFKKGELVDFIVQSLSEDKVEEILKERGLIPDDVVSDEEVLAAMNPNRTIDDDIYLKYLLTFLNKKSLTDICKLFFLEGCSKYSKGDLIENIIDSLAEEEKRRLLYEKELEIISEGLDLAFKKIRGEDRETISNIRIVNEEEHEVELQFKGFSWEVNSYVSIRDDNMDDPERDCDCRIGSAKGFCNHFWAGVIFSIKQGWFDISDWTLTKLPDDLEQKIESINISVGADGTSGGVSMLDESSEDFELKAFENQSITIYEGEVTEIERKESVFQENITIWYLTQLKDVRLGPRVQKKADFKEEAIKDIAKLNLRLSEKLIDDNNLETGDKIGGNGKLTHDNFLKMYIVKNIRKIEKV